MDKPTIDDIKRRFKSYERYYSQLHQDQQDMDDYYELVFDAGVPANYPERMPSTARDWIDVGVRHFTLDNPKAKVYQRNDSEAAKKQVEILETFYDFWLRTLILKIKDAAKKLLLYGEVFLEVGMDDTYFGTESEERLFHFPLTFNVVHPLNVYCSPAHNGLVPVDVIKSFNITVAEAEELCDRNKWIWKPKKPKLEPDNLVNFKTFTNKDWRCFMIENEPILKQKVQPNIFGFCPYVHIGSGAGQSSYEGKPEYLYRSLIWGKRDMLKLEVRTLSALDAINSRYAFPRFKIKMANLNDDLLKKLYPSGKVPTDPDKLIYEVKDQLEIEMIEGEQPPAGLFQEYAFLQSQAQPPEVLAGLRPTGVYSGQHQETLLATAKPIYKDAFKNLEDGLAVAMGMGTRIIEKVYNYDVQIKNFASEDNKTYRTIKPEDIKGHYDCEVQLLAEPPEATDIRKALGKGLRQGGSISHMTELRQYEDMSEKEAEDEIAQIIAETALQEPGLRVPIVKNAMARLGMDKELEILEAAEQAQNQKIAKAIPPVNVGEGINTEMARTRGRSEGFETVASPREQRIAARLQA